MVFRGQLLSGTVGVYVTTRPTLGSKFGMPTLLDDAACNEHAPAFAPDCSHVYYTCDSPDRVNMLF